MDHGRPVISPEINPGIGGNRALSWARPGSMLSWLAGLASRPGISLGLAGAIAVTDLTIGWQDLGFLPRALIDEPCHLATALVVLGAITRWRGSPPGAWFGWSLLSASVLIDLDHVPRQLGWPALTAGTPRPYTHALWIVALFSVAAALAWRHSRRAGTPRSTAAAGLLTGAAWGLAAHFLRDVATAPISLWWPLSDAGVQVAYWWYLGALLVLAVLPPRHPGHDDRPGPARRSRATRRGRGGPGREPAPWRPG